MVLIQNRSQLPLLKLKLDTLIVLCADKLLCYVHILIHSEVENQLDIGLATPSCKNLLTTETSVVRLYMIEEF